MEQDIRYPIGRVQFVEYNEAVRQGCINDIFALPTMLEAAVQGLDEQQLHRPYREGGWTPNQIVHHLADSHMNAWHGKHHTTQIINNYETSFIGHAGPSANHL